MGGITLQSQQREICISKLQKEKNLKLQIMVGHVWGDKQICLCCGFLVMCYDGSFTLLDLCGIYIYVYSLG
jgi:hypothetical protein